LKLEARHPERHESAEGESRDRAVVAVGNGAQCLIDVVHQFRKVERIRAHGFDGAAVHDDDVMCGHVTRGLGIALLVGLLVAVEPVDDRVAFLRSGVSRRQYHLKTAAPAQHLAVMRHLLYRRDRWRRAYLEQPRQPDEPKINPHY
jgi:hypothetical protein